MTDDHSVSDGVLDRATAAIHQGDLVVYPTETVYGLGADALNVRAVERVFDAKRRDETEPISMAVPSVGAATEYTAPTDRERRFMETFLPGPVTVVVERKPAVPDSLTAGRDRVGIRVPDHEVALSLLERTGPVTATSANVSGTGSVMRVDTLDSRIADRATVVVDDGETPGGGSTVVDVSRGQIYRAGPLAGEIEAWLDAG